MNNYLSSVVKSGQVNTPPGSYLTIKEWIRNSFINNQSNILEIGCSTGFITIEIARYTEARCVGVDIDQKSIASAKSNVDEYIADKVLFQQGDAGRLPFENNTFSHVVIGGHLPFTKSNNRRSHVIEALRVLKPWRYMLVALYYYHSSPPNNLIAEFNAKIGTKLSTSCTKDYWDRLFANLLITLEYESEYNVVPADDRRIKEYISQMSPNTRNDWQEYLHLFNENGKFLSYFVRIYRKIPDEGNLMIQVPRGGIYTVNKKYGDNL